MWVAEIRVSSVICNSSRAKWFRLFLFIIFVLF